MKKFLAILMLVFVAFISNAQTVTYYPMQLSDTKFVSSGTYVLTNTTARNFVLETSKQVPTTQDFYVKLDSLAGNHTNVAVALYGAKFSDTAYDQIGSTVNWKGTTKDTTIVVSNATANRYNYFKWVLTGTGTGTTTVTKQQLKLYLEH